MGLHDQYWNHGVYTLTGGHISAFIFLMQSEKLRGQGWFECQPSIIKPMHTEKSNLEMKLLLKKLEKIIKTFIMNGYSILDAIYN